MTPSPALPGTASTPGDVPDRLADAFLETVGGADGQGHFSNLNTKRKSST